MNEVDVYIAGGIRYLVTRKQVTAYRDGLIDTCVPVGFLPVDD